MRSVAVSEEHLAAHANDNQVAGYERTLLLSAAYEPILAMPWQRAITLQVLEKVELVEAYDTQIRAASVSFHTPAVVRLVRGFRRHQAHVRFSRGHVYARDGYRCQYCGFKGVRSQLTYDHVVPRSKNGGTSWENVVACCHPCNRKKGGRTPEEAGMRLAKAPVRPDWIPAVSLFLSLRVIPEKWDDYLSPWLGKWQKR